MTILYIANDQQKRERIAEIIQSAPEISIVDVESIEAAKEWLDTRGHNLKYVLYEPEFTDQMKRLGQRVVTIERKKDIDLFDFIEDLRRVLRAA